MRAAFYYNNHDVRVKKMPVPKIGPGELLVRVEACGICGSDVAEWDRLPKAPLVLGHEIAGVVVGVGEGVDRYKEGDRITAAHHVPCNDCRYCHSGHETTCDTLRRTRFDPGGFAEFIRIPAINVESGVFEIPDHVTYAEASLTEPLACVLRGQRMAGLQPGKSVLVLGSGVAGLIHVHLARFMGATPVVATDVSQYRMEAAVRFGADEAWHVSEDIESRFRKINDGYLADMVIVCTTAQSAFDQSLTLVERGGTVLFFAPPEPGFRLEVPVNQLFYRNDITLTTSYAGSPDDYAMALEMISERKVQLGDLITHRFGLSEVQKGFELVAAAQESLKVIIEPQR
jgi:L-iditol 2-dehydrogenase